MDDGIFAPLSKPSAGAAPGRAWDALPIDFAARRLAEDAAAASGVTVETWLEGTIRHACPGALPPDSTAMARGPAATEPAEGRLDRRALAARAMRWLLRPGVFVLLPLAAGAATAEFVPPAEPPAVVAALAPDLSAPAMAVTPPASGAASKPAERTAPDATPAALPVPAPVSDIPAADQSPRASPREGAPAARGRSDAVTEPAADDPKQLAAWLDERSERGDATAQYRLAALYALGHGVPQDYTRAAALFRAAADAGIADAQYNLGVMYASGMGVDKDVPQAIDWYRKAAEQGNANAAFNLGAAYSGAEGVQRDLNEAAIWFERAAKWGVVDAQYNLGRLYETGKGVPMSPADAYAWYDAAAQRGDRDAAEHRDQLAATMTPARLNDARTRAAALAQTIASAAKAE